jgi:hypothetical protein
VVERIELAPDTVAAASEGQRLGLLALEGELSDRRLRIDVREIGQREGWTVHWRDALAAATDAAPRRAWPLELALAPRAPLVALGANRVSVLDFLRGVPVLEGGQRR